MLPYTADIKFARTPWANTAVMAAMVLGYLFFLALSPNPFSFSQATRLQNIRPLTLSSLAPLGMFSHIWIHSSLPILMFNLTGLYLFGFAVNAKLGNIFYLAVFIAIAILADLLQLLFSNRMIVGANASLCCVAAFYFVLYPLEKIPLPPFFRFINVASLTGGWFVLCFVAFLALTTDLVVNYRPYIQHITAFAIGAALAVFLLRRNIIRSSPGETSILGIGDSADSEIETPIRPNLGDHDSTTELAKLRFRRPKPVDDGPVITLSLPELQKPSADSTASAPADPATAPRIAVDPDAPSAPPRKASRTPDTQPLTQPFIVFTCPCGQTYQLDASMAGKKVRCFICKNIMTVPNNPTLTRIDDLKL